MSHWKEGRERRRDESEEGQRGADFERVVSRSRGVTGDARKMSEGSLKIDFRHNLRRVPPFPPRENKLARTDSIIFILLTSLPPSEFTRELSFSRLLPATFSHARVSLVIERNDETSPINRSRRTNFDRRSRSI